MIQHWIDINKLIELRNNRLMILCLVDLDIRVNLKIVIIKKITITPINKINKINRNRINRIDRDYLC